jgi:hypothetical protein
LHKKRSLTLAPEDALIVLRQDGTCEVSLPVSETGDLPEHVLMGAALVSALQDQELCSLIQSCFLDKSSTRGDTSSLSLPFSEHTVH